MRVVRSCEVTSHPVLLCSERVHQRSVVQLRALVSHSVYSHPEGTSVFLWSPFLTPRMRAWSRAAQEARRDSCFLVRVPEPLRHPRLDSTDGSRGFVLSSPTYVSQNTLDHFSNTPVAFCSLLVIADPLFPQRWIFAPTCVIVLDHGIECLVIGQKVLSITSSAFLHHNLEIVSA